jgi:dihydroorotate dehydrogenase/NAD-dependent dihydropyrimidine dehydrogenase PreA subunit
MADLTVEIAGIKFRNPVLTAAGPPSKDGEALAACARGGAGGLVAKTVSVEAAKVPRPNMLSLARGGTPAVQVFTVDGKIHRVARTFLRDGKGFSNTELWTDLPLEEWLDVHYTRAKEADLPLIASVGYTIDDMSTIIPRIKEVGCDGIEFSTHYIEPGIVGTLVRTIKSLWDVPVFPKLSPHEPETLVEQAKDGANSGADGIVAINSFGPTLHFDVEECRPLLGSTFGFGWISGAPLKPIATRCIFDIARNVDVPVIGVGGVLSGLDAVEHMMAGARAVQICTGAILEGPEIYGRVTREIGEFMDRKGLASLDDLVGAYMRGIGEGQHVRTEGGRSEVDEELCKSCGLCEVSCVYGAIRVPKEGGLQPARVDREKCQACGLCVSVCPMGAPRLAFEEP